MHNRKLIKLFRPFLIIIPVYLLCIFQFTGTRAQERLPETGHPSTVEDLTVPASRIVDTLRPPAGLMPPDTVTMPPDTAIMPHGTLVMPPGTSIPDTLLPGMGPPLLDERPSPARNNNFLNSKVESHANDSSEFSVTDQKLFLWGEAWIKYEGIELHADYIEIDLARKEVFASGLTDEDGNVTGRPVMTEGGERYEAETMRYNFETKRGLITGIVTEQEGGFLHGYTTKKHENDHLHISGGKYTTCDHEHPHYYVALTRAKVIPNDKVVSGPAYLVIEDIPLPLALPFGFFPNKRGQTSGILFPTYGEEASRGFYLRGAGYYLNLNEYMDLRLTGDIYSLGSWAVDASSNYRRRYRYGGSFRYAYSRNVVGERGFANFRENTSYNIAWRHQQDPKASPYSNFGASVNFGSSSFNQFNTIDPDRFAQNTAQSSINFSHRWPDSPFSFTSSVSANQNFSNQTVNLTLPSMNFNMQRQYPFRNPNRVGPARWYDQVEISYSSKLDNRLQTYDSLLFTREVLQDLESGFRHEIPLRANFRLMNLVNVSPSLTYLGVLYPNSIRKFWDEDHINPVTGANQPSLVTENVPGLVYGHALTPSIGASVSQNIYGMFQFRNSRIEAIRHVMVPSVSFSYTPDLTGIVPDYYRTVETDNPDRPHVYSIFEGQMYGTPTMRGRAGSISFGLNNNIEMKVRNHNDTTSQSTKVKIIDRLNFSTSYNIYAEQFHWSPLQMSGSTSLFSNNVSLTFGATMDPYALDENNRRIDRFQWSDNRMPGRITRANLGLTMRLRSAAGSPAPGMGMDTGPGSMPPGPMMDHETDMMPGEDIFGHLDDIDPTIHYYGDYVDFNVPWNLNVNYSLNYTRPQREGQIIQTVRFNGDVSLTPRWKITFSSGYDFRAGEFTMTNISVARDLHCWEMFFGVVPFGPRKQWNFTIRVRSSILKDLKYHTQRSWYDNFFR